MSDPSRSFASPDDLQAYLAEGPPVREGDYAGLLGQALQDLRKLSPEWAGPVQEWIESQVQAAKTDLQGQFEGDHRTLEAEVRPQLDRIEQRHRSDVQAIAADHDKQQRALDAQAEARRQEVIRLATQRQAQVAQVHKDQVMEAEFLIDGALDKAKQRRKQAQAAFQLARQRLEQIRREADDLMRRYHEPIPAWPEVAGPDPAADPRPGKVRHTQEALVRQHLEALRRLWPARFLGGHWSPVKGPGRRVRHAYTAFQGAWTQALRGLEAQLRRDLQGLDQRFGALVEQGKAERRRATQVFEAAEARILEHRRAALAEIEQARVQAVGRVSRNRAQAIKDAEQQYRNERSRVEQAYERDLAELRQGHDQAMAKTEAEYRHRLDLVHSRWDKALARIEAVIEASAGLDPRTVGDWETGSVVGRGDCWAPPTQTPSQVRVGTWQIDLGRLDPAVLAYAGSRLQGRGTQVLPAVLAMPGRCSLLVQHQREGRQEAIETLRAVMVRLFAAMPPGRALFTIIDPVALGQSFAGFMHAGDYRESLVGGRIWTEAAEIQGQLEDLTNHMENVIQKYLRNEFETIEQYNRQAGQLAEPYRFLVMADFPTHLNEDAARRLASIVHSGPRCGVHFLIAYDARQEIPAGIDPNDLAAAGVHLIHEADSAGAGRFVWQDEALRHFPLVLDRPPSEKVLTEIMRTVGKASVDSARVEVPFESIAPTEAQVWSLDSRQDLRVPIGRTGATRLQVLHLGRGVAQHMLIAGKTGSGKSTLLHVIVTNLALWYGPDQVELYLIDFKKGVEFKTYATHNLPHARAVAIESDREFGLSILHRLNAEMTRRGELFRQAGVQDIAAYRQATNQGLPRTVLIVDEFQVFFGEDDKLAQDAAIGLEQLVRQGRAFGIHVILGSQTLGGAFGLARSTMGQMAVRIALQCSEADSQLILDDENIAARRLARPGEAIYNDAGGRVTGNSPFQTAWLPDTVRDRYLAQIRSRAVGPSEAATSMVVFEGNAPADVADNPRLAACLRQGPSLDAGASPLVWLGSPVAIKEPTAATLRRQSGANLLIVGQREDLAANLMGAGLIGLAAQLRPDQVRFVILDGGPAGSAPSQLLGQVTSILARPCQIISLRDVPEAIADLAGEAQQRTQSDVSQALPTIVLLIYALQRYSVLRREEDAFGLPMADQGTPQPGVQFADLLRTGPSVGIHVVAWADTLATLERTLDRQTLREFDWRVLFQMGAADSSNLIDSPAANQLGFHRAILYSQEQGGLEKFRPYAAIREDWLAEAATRLAANDRSQ